jgi:hypothetical protein
MDVTDSQVSSCLQEMYGLTMGGPDDMTSEQQVAKQVSLEQTSLENELVLPNLVSVLVLWGETAVHTLTSGSCTSTASEGIPILRTLRIRRDITGGSPKWETRVSQLDSRTTSMLTAQSDIKPITSGFGSTGGMAQRRQRW